MRRAFLSHSTSDDRYVSEMTSFLHAAGFDEVFNDDRSIQPGRRVWEEIEKGIRDCDSFFVLITAASNASDWVKCEVELADSLAKEIIPIQIEDCEVPAIFKGRDVIDFRPRSRQERHFDIGRIIIHAPAELIGREDETGKLSEAWQKVLRVEKGRPHILTFVALGGEGKTSLVAKWAAELAAQNWPGCETVFAWSFYSQGTREQVAASSDLFLKEALNFFSEGDPKEEEIKTFAASPAGAFEKGQRLARIVGQRRSLLILDGLEPLQYSPASPTPGQLKDQGIAALLKGLATASHGLCVVTTRYSVPDLRAFWQTTAREVNLLRLSRDAGVHLLKTLGVRKESGTVQEFETLVEDVKGHALTLTLLGGFLKRAFRGDIRQRDRVKFEKADEKISGGHAFRVLDAYVHWFEQEETERTEKKASVSSVPSCSEGKRAVAVLRLMGLFDRPADAGCLAALRREPIPGLTEPLAGLADDDWEFCLSGLEAAKLLTVNRDATGALVSLDAHPHLREYFAKQLREQNPDAWRAAHRRLYEHLCATTKEGDQPTLEDLQPLYQAVAHGCQGELGDAVFSDVMWPRILRGEDQYSWKSLGATASDLSAIAYFFESPWTKARPGLSKELLTYVFGAGGFYLQCLSRFQEAKSPMEEALRQCAEMHDWKYGSRAASNLSELYLGQGLIESAITQSEVAVKFADLASDDFFRTYSRSALSECLFYSGDFQQAKKQLEIAESLHLHGNELRTTSTPTLVGVQAFRQNKLDLGVLDQALWRFFLGLPAIALTETVTESLSLIEDRAKASLQFVSSQSNLLNEHQAKLILILVFSYRKFMRTTVEVSDDRDTPIESFESIVDGIRRANLASSFVEALIYRAQVKGWLSQALGARRDLDEAWEIAERGPMRLFLADIHLHRARLFFREEKYPWESPATDLAAAEKLINDCGYHRRDEELADAKAAILHGQPPPP